MPSAIFTAEDLMLKFGLNKSDLLRLILERRLPRPRKLFAWHLEDIKNLEKDTYERF